MKNILVVNYNNKPAIIANPEILNGSKTYYNMFWDNGDSTYSISDLKGNKLGLIKRNDFNTDIQLTHSQLIDKLKFIIGEEQFKSILKINKGNISGNYLNVLFKNEEDRSTIINNNPYFLNCTLCEKRYGIGIIFN